MRQPVAGCVTGREILQLTAGEDFQHSLDSEQSTLRTVDAIKFNPVPKVVRDGEQPPLERRFGPADVRHGMELTEAQAQPDR